ncbi:Hypothetical protein R9X50_00796500 [Acrodontium crateriforme]|uniref:Uncharacterized protein n=1 Tax=Acrodontium crateriforme TaxID=150365 RepID=A0AAQ3MDD0_9PEZI|nr:Hypothetical protein R9X50_00796500 [Acrodontium crateriforme]
MPLTTRDVNVMREPKRSNGWASPQHPAASQFHFGDENSPSLHHATAKTLTPSTPLPRLLASTKASTARSANPPSSGHNTPQGYSRLPLRSLASATPPLASKWSFRGGMSSTPQQGMANKQYRALNDRKDDSLTPTSANRPLPTNKPLPARPMVTLANSLSPSKDSRGLIDASEPPLTVAVQGSQVDWPALTPSSPDTLNEVGSDQESRQNSNFRPPSPSNVASQGTPATTIAKQQVHGANRKSSPTTAGHEVPQILPSSSPLSFVTAGHEGSGNGPPKPGVESAIQRNTPSSENYSSTDDLGETDRLTRQASIRSRISNGSIVAPSINSRTTGFTDFTRNEYALTESRPLSPSPASFSRLRRSNKVSTLSINTVNSTASHLKTPKTASRIPIPDSRKATLVEVRSRNSSDPSMIDIKPETVPTFASRRVDADGPLQILDQGVKRRQLKRADTKGSMASSSPEPSKPEAGQELDGNQDDSNGAARYFDNYDDVQNDCKATSSPPSHHVTRLSCFAEARQTDSYHQRMSYKLFDNAISGHSNPPPSTSPYTGPLQTIPSQSVLPLETFESYSTRMPSSKETEFPMIAQRLSELHSAHYAHTQKSSNSNESIPDDIKNSLVDILRQYEREDNRLSREGYTGLNDETRKHITLTLTLLEGRGSPPKTEVDNETLLTMFGHLRRGLEKAPKTASLTENAAAAEMFLARQSGANSASSRSCSKYAMAGQAELEREVDSSSERAQFTPQTVAGPTMSKWSYSTPSDKGTSPAIDDLSPSISRRAIDTALPIRQKQTIQSQSIGYPSIIESKTSMSTHSNALESANPPKPISSVSSSGGEKRRPGSVRAARESLYQMPGGFARTTAAAESKRATRLPTPSSKHFKIAGDTLRGRHLSGEKQSSSKSPMESQMVQYDTCSTEEENLIEMQTPRSRSKSRFMLEKINGLFSGRREKKASEVPPVPKIANKYTVDESIIHGQSNAQSVSPTPQTSLSTIPLTASRSDGPLPELTNQEIASNDNLGSTVDITNATKDDVDVINEFTASLEKRAEIENSAARKERLLSFAKALRKSVISAKEAEISAEVAKEAAARAAVMYQMAQQSLHVLSRLTSSLSNPNRK